MPFEIACHRIVLAIAILALAVSVARICKGGRV